MTPAARYAAAIEVLDLIQLGQVAEKVLTNWGRQHRFAGSKDRAAIRDHVFDVLRMKRSCAAYGGGESGRQLVLGILRQQDSDLSAIFTGEGYAPNALSDIEFASVTPALSEAEKHDLPDWAWEHWCASLGDVASDAALSQRSRAPIALRVNLRNAEPSDVISALAKEDITAVRHPNVATCLHVLTNPRRVSLSQPFLSGQIEFQDASSQSAVASLNIPAGAQVLDYCSGGGGKALAIADRFDASICAYDKAEHRMADIPARASRAGSKINVLSEDLLKKHALFDFIFCDAPCSGSGTWRRTPDAKWRLDNDDFAAFPELQLSVLQDASAYLQPNGQLAYATCSVFDAENHEVVKRFLAQNNAFTLVQENQIVPTEHDDGFYLSVLQRN